MRRTHNPQLILSEPYIAGNKINLKSRDDILVILTRTAQQIYLELINANHNTIHLWKSAHQHE